ncbi:DUF6318 family protein [Georgenia sp. Z1344]|uniref:DUF6318 family protein n=1 Tax=Georgenia sp. Z1344 TaxID=3416706 RepID=UPI003CFBAF03
MLIAALGLAACGDGDDDESSTGPGTGGDGPTSEPTSESGTSETGSEGGSETGSDGGSNGGESPTEAPSGGEESPSEVSTDDIDFTEWELERRGRPAPEQPPEMSEDGEAGAVATAEYVVELLDYASVTGNVAELEEIASPDCGTCRDATDQIRTNVREGIYIDSESFVLYDSLAGQSETDPSTWSVAVQGLHEAGTEADHHGELIGEFAAQSVTYFVDTSWDGNRWTVSGLSTWYGDEEANQ